MPGTELLYSGRLAGTFFTAKGGGADYLCLPDNPEYIPSGQILELLHLFMEPSMRGHLLEPMITVYLALSAILPQGFLRL